VSAGGSFAQTASRGASGEAAGAARWRDAPYAAAVAPAGVLLGLFFVAPAVWAIAASLTDRTLLGVGATEPTFIGLDNYRRLWQDPDFWQIARNTVVFVAGSAVIGQTGLGLLLALLLDHARRAGSRLVPIAYAAVLSSWITPPAVAGSIWGGLFEFRHGVVNEALKSVGMAPVDVLGRFPMAAVVIADAWHGAAFAMVILLGALRTVPPDVYEAARVDGAGAWRRFRDHTMPLIGHLLAIVLIMTTIVTSSSFLLIFAMTNGSTGLQTETLALFSFHRAFVDYEIGFAAAISVVLLLANLALSVLFLRVARGDR